MGGLFRSKKSNSAAASQAKAEAATTAATKAREELVAAETASQAKREVELRAKRKEADAERKGARTRKSLLGGVIDEDGNDGILTRTVSEGK